jgi:hypothetical protein
MHTGDDVVLATTTHEKSDSILMILIGSLALTQM